MNELQQGFLTAASAISATLLNALWQDALLVLCVWLLLRVWPGINAATRYAVWSATLVAAFVVPVATTLAFFAPAPGLSAAHDSGARHTVAITRAAPQRATAFTQRQTVATPPAAQPETPRLPQRAHVTLPGPVAITVFVLWTVLAGYALVRLALGLIRLEQLKRDALPLPIEYRDAMPQWLRANKGARDVRLCVSDATDVPVAVGLFDAMILIPRSLLDHLSEPEVDQICLHELAHLRRADDWTNGLQRVISALLGWNPAAQFVGQQLDLEREVACDDWVLSLSGAVRPYALCLTKMAESAAWPRHPIPAPGVFATRKHISLRIERLLGAGRNIATNLSLAPAAAAVAIVGAIALAIAVVAPSVAAPVLPAIAATAATAPRAAASAAP
ncbi:MAG: M56 family metallopeptidase, partial [Candidatus Cybelea sp.]